MSLSISSSKNEFKTCLATLAVLLLLELIVHSYQDRLSGDLEHLSTIRAIAQSFHESTAAKVLFLGNSLTREGLALDIVKERFAGGPLDAVNWQKAYPDDTNIGDWYYLYKDRFARTRSMPDAIIVGFARNQLADVAGIHVDGIAASFGGLKNVPEIFEKDITDSSERVDYVLASISSLFANRRRIGLRVADMFIPHYRFTAQYFNEAVRSTTFSKSDTKRSTYHRLMRLAQLCQQENTLLIAVAMPIPYSYEIDVDLLKTLADSGNIFIDLRHVDGIRNEQYSDGFHLNSTGAAIYSRALAESLQNQAHLDSFLNSRNRLRAASGQ
jgi:hypothetical protein